MPAPDLRQAPQWSIPRRIRQVHQSRQAKKPVNTTVQASASPIPPPQRKNLPSKPWLTQYCRDRRCRGSSPRDPQSSTGLSEGPRHEAHDGVLRRKWRTELTFPSRTRLPWSRSSSCFTAIRKANSRDRYVSFTTAIPTPQPTNGPATYARDFKKSSATAAADICFRRGAPGMGIAGSTFADRFDSGMAHRRLGRPHRRRSLRTGRSFHDHAVPARSRLSPSRRPGV